MNAMVPSKILYCTCRSPLREPNPTTELPRLTAQVCVVLIKIILPEMKWKLDTGKELL